MFPVSSALSFGFEKDSRASHFGRFVLGEGYIAHDGTPLGLKGYRRGDDANGVARVRSH